MADLHTHTRCTECDAYLQAPGTKHKSWHAKMDRTLRDLESRLKKAEKA